MRLVSAALFALLAVASGLTGQDLKTRAVHGTVTDRKGNALKGAVVQIENEQNLAIASYVTQADGTYHFHELSTDVNFTLRAHYRKKWSHSKLLNKFNEARNPEINLTIPTE